MSRNSKIIFIAMILVCFCHFQAVCSTEIDAVSFHLGKTYNSYLADFSQLQGVPACCPRFESGSGNSFGGGLSAEFNVYSLFSAALRVSLFSKDATLSADENRLISLNGKSVMGTFRHEIESKLLLLQIDPVFFQDFGYFGLFAGPSIQVPVLGRYRQKEIFVSPLDEGTFADSSRTRNRRSGSLPGMAPAAVSLTAGISLRLQLNSSGSLFLAPELSYNLGLTSILKGSKLNINNLFAGVGFSYSFEHFQDSRANEPRGGKEMNRPIRLSASYAFISNGSELPDSLLVVESRSTVIIRYVSPAIEFTSGKSIPGDLSSSLHARNYAHPAMQYLDTLASMIRAGTINSIKLVAEYSGSSDKDTADIRLNAVVRMIREKVAGSGINIEMEKRQGTGRRVDISSSPAAAILCNSVQKNSLSFHPDSIRFYCIAYSKSNIKSSSINIISGGKLIQKFDAQGPSAEIRDFAASSIAGGIDPRAGIIEYFLSAEDSSRNKDVSPRGIIPVQFRNDTIPLIRMEIPVVNSETGLAYFHGCLENISSMVLPGMKITISALAPDKSGKELLSKLLAETAKSIKYPCTVDNEIKNSAAETGESVTELYKNMIIITLE